MLDSLLILDPDFFCVEFKKVLRSKRTSPARLGHWHLLFSFLDI